jgi:hypothetical protein
MVICYNFQDIKVLLTCGCWLQFKILIGNTTSKEHTFEFLKVIRNVKVLDGYASNFSRCIKIKEREYEES